MIVLYVEVNETERLRNALIVQKELKILIARYHRFSKLILYPLKSDTLFEFIFIDGLAIVYKDQIDVIAADFLLKLLL